MEPENAPTPPTAGADPAVATPGTASGTAVPGQPPAPSTTDLMAQFGVFGLIFLVFYLLLIRPQQKRMRAHEDSRSTMLKALKRNDRVVTQGGLIGRISKLVGDDEIELEIADNVRVRMAKTAVTSLKDAAKDAPAEDAKAA